MWAPWRINYIRGKKQKRCIFCDAAIDKKKDYVIFKTLYSTAILNIYPYNNGHIMVSPKRHVRDLTQLADAEALDLFKALSKTKKLLNRVLKPEGYNIGINLEKSAGAGIAAHIHIHIVPRWQGDTNFMPIFNNTRVISQSLKELFKQLKNAQSKTD
ncbi:MAG: HIT domain-containing protein [Candidatus Omnitrophica bacterium]|nr:HIT domain-containing protein [Candidatus Omnitrophota bacterium]